MNTRTTLSLVIVNIVCMVLMLTVGWVMGRDKQAEVDAVELRIAHEDAVCPRVPACPAPEPSRPSELWDAAYREGFKRGSGFFDSQHLEESVADCARLLAECRQPQDVRALAAERDAAARRLNALLPPASPLRVAVP